MNKITEIGYLCISWVIIRALTKYLNIGRFIAHLGNYILLNIHITVLVSIDVKYVILHISTNLSLLLFKISRLKYREAEIRLKMQVLKDFVFLNLKLLTLI